MNQSKYILTTPIFSKQQLCIVELMAQGWENAEIGRRLFLSPKTVKYCQLKQTASWDTLEPLFRVKSQTLLPSDFMFNAEL